jgi:hypothetical protein
VTIIILVIVNEIDLEISMMFEAQRSATAFHENPFTFACSYLPLRANVSKVKI